MCIRDSSQIVQFGRSEKIETEISVGDMVLISTGYPLKSDLTGTVVEKGARFIKVAFEKSIPKWALKKKVRIDLYANDVTSVSYTHLYYQNKKN